MTSAALQPEKHARPQPEASTPQGTRRASGPSRFAYLDGMRAVAALYVVFFHAVIGFPRGELAGPWRLLRRASAFGHEAVAVFIVLSGYCLMLPVVRSGDGKLPRSLASFIARRALRILPPYYASVLVSLALLASVEVLRRPGSRTIWDDSLPGFGWGSALSHLLVVHNWFPRWAYQINGPLWSVATEWQIYFFFPLLLLPLWRRFGAGASALVGLAVGFAPLLVYPAGSKTAIPWYLALFAFGMGAAGFVHSGSSPEGALRARGRFGVVTAVLWFCAVVGGWGFGTVWFRLKPLTDVLLGLATASFLVYAAQSVELGAPNRLAVLLASRPAVALGHMSYSLYLTHLPVLALCHFALLAVPLSPGFHALAVVAVGVPLSLLWARFFYWAIERHCVAPFSPPLRRVLSLVE